MDPELKKLLEAAHAAGASDDDLGKLIDRWNADHAGTHGPVDISAQLQQQYDAQRPKAPPGPMAVLKSTPGVFSAPETADRRRMVGTTALGMMIPETKIATALDAVPGVGPFVARLATRAATGAGLGALAAGPGNRVSGATAGAVLNPIVSGATGMVAKRLEPIATKLAAKGMDYANLYDALDKAKLAERNAAYGAAEQAAAGRTPTPAVQAVLQDPYMKPEVDALDMAQFAGMPRTDPRFINELYQGLSDTQARALRGVKSNSKDAVEAEGNALKEQLLTALESPSAPGANDAYMPEYRPAVAKAKEGFTQLDALQKGYEALPALAKPTQMTQQQVENLSMPALQNFLAGKSPEVDAQLRTGIQASNNANKLVGWRRLLGPIGVPMLNGTAKTAPAVLSALGDPAQLARDKALTASSNAARNGFLSWLITQGYLPPDSTGGTPP